MTHDPLCPVRAENFVSDDECPECSLICRCDLIARVRIDQDRKHINPNCMWGQAECVPDCPSCRRLDDLYMERSVGYWEGYNNAINQNKECTHRSTPDIWQDEVPYCRKCGADMSSQYEMGN